MSFLIEKETKMNTTKLLSKHKVMRPQNANLLTPLVFSFFRDEKQAQLFKIMCLSTVFNVALVIFRMYHVKFNPFELHTLDEWQATRGAFGSFFFLIWNLFLAWIPYWVALTLDFWSRFSRQNAQKLTLSAGVLIVTWLLFFPNAPYIVTDLLHLKDREIVPHWYDLMLIVSFAWTGLLLGYLSLFEVQRYLEARFSRVWVWTLLIGAIWLAGFGVYMGRFQRWNSWDIVTRPWAIIEQQLHVLSHPMVYLNTLGVAVVMSGFMFIGYLTLNALRGSAA